MIIFILILLIYGTAIFLADNLVIKEVVIVGGTATVMYMYLQINLLKSFLLSGLFHALLLLVDYLTLLLAVTFFEGITQLGQEYIIEGVLTIVLAKTVLFFCVILFKQYIGRKRAILLSDAEWLKFIYFPVFTICILVAMINTLGGMENQKAEEIFFVIAIGLAGMNIVVFYLINDILECQTAHCGRCKPHFDFGVIASPIVPYRNLPQAPDGMTADCRSLVSKAAGAAFEIRP